MRFCLRFILLIGCFLWLANGDAAAQNMPIGYWRSHLPYNRVIGVATDGATIYAISEQAFFSYNAVSGEMSTYSKVDGMAGVGMSQIAYDAATNTVVLAYSSTDIDLFKDNSFYNMPDIRIKVFTGTKTINNIYTDRGMAYVSTSLGIVVINLDKREVKETYVFSKNSQTIGINALTADDNYFYAATGKGLYRASRNSPSLQLFSTWTALDTVHNFISLATVGTKVFASDSDSLFVVNGNNLQYLLRTNNNTVRIDPGKDVLNLSLLNQFQSKVKQMNMSYVVTDSFNFNNPKQTTMLADGSLWVADGTEGLTKISSGNRTSLIPPGPYSYATFDILPYNKDVWVAHGGYRDNWSGLNYSRDGVSHFKDETWTNYRDANTPAMSGMQDVIDISKDPSGNVYCGSVQEGMVVFRPDGSSYRIKQDSLQTKDNEPNVYPATSSETDQNGALWVTQLGAPNELAVRTKDGVWHHYPTADFGGYAYSGAGLIIDDYNQKWYYGLNRRGLIVYNDNGTPETNVDDYFHLFANGAGSGNLPSRAISCIAKDRDGAIWVGTDDGIGIINCASVAAQGACDGELRVVQYDQFAGYLFKGEQVKSIAVDGGNRKWVGTNNGIWLISPDANKIIQRFTVDNSPLPSNVIQKIAVDPVTGDVYVGTAQGMVSYRGTSTEGGTTNVNVVTYPNPVPSGYSGTIAIRGLVTDGDVRITDIAGQLIYRTKAQGGQATWNGLDYTGHRPQSGVYLIFVTNKDGSQTHVGKMMFQH